MLDPNPGLGSGSGRDLAKMFFVGIGIFDPNPELGLGLGS